MNNSTPTSERAVRAAIGEAERAFEKCWAILRRLRRASGNRDLLEFQPQLAEAMARLVRVDVAIARERRKLVGRKARLRSEWFVSRQRLLASRRDLVRRAMGVGWSMGDAFAWIFYQNSPELLAKHTAEPPTDRFSGTQGGAAELEFIRRTPAIGEWLVLYHGITTILRLSDVSLIDLDSWKVVGLGELKAGQPDGQRLPVELHIVRSRLSNDAPPGGAGSSPPARGVIESLRPQARARFRRQTRRMVAAIRDDGKDRIQVGVEVSPTYAKELSAALGKPRPGKMAHVYLGGGLMAAIYRSRHESLYTRLKHNTTVMQAAITSEVAECALKTCVIGSRYNALYYGPLHYSPVDGQPWLPLGTMPPLWQAINPDKVKAVWFREVEVFLLFNPARLFAGLEAEGFRISRFNFPRDLAVEWEVDGKRLQIEGIDSYLRMVQFGLSRESHVVQMLIALATRIVDQGLTQTTRIDLQFAPRFGTPATFEDEGSVI